MNVKNTRNNKEVIQNHVIDNIANILRRSGHRWMKKDKFKNQTWRMRVKEIGVFSRSKNVE